MFNIKFVLFSTMTFYDIFSDPVFFYSQKRPCVPVKTLVLNFRALRLPLLES